MFAALCGAVLLIIDFTLWQALLELVLLANVAVQYLINYYVKKKYQKRAE
ncbi:MAG: hypothetical protein U5L00_13505 [Desulfovermiculus sp.]|nr:hypothetical protein [Desulfovermiculus sp.]